MSGTAALAQCVLSVSASDMTERLLDQAKVEIADTIGRTLEGAARVEIHETAFAAGAAAAPGPALILGTPRRTAAADAAFVNGLLFAAAPEDDQAKSDDPALALSLIALAEERKLSGLDLLTSYVAGKAVRVLLERSSDIGSGISLDTIVVAAASAHLMKLDARGVAAALEAGLSLSYQKNGGRFDVAIPARDGLIAALFAKAGWESGPGQSSGCPGRALSNDADTVAPQEFLVPWKASSMAIRCEDLWDSFHQRSAAALRRGQAGSVFECLETLETATDINRVTALLAVGEGPTATKRPLGQVSWDAQGIPQSDWVP